MLVTAIKDVISSIHDNWLSKFIRLTYVKSSLVMLALETISIQEQVYFFKGRLLVLVDHLFKVNQARVPFPLPPFIVPNPLSQPKVILLQSL